MNDSRVEVVPSSSPSDVIAWVQALTLEERIEFSVAGSTVSDEALQLFLERWAKAVAKGDRAALARRLAWDSISETQIAGALAPVSDNSSAPAWLATIDYVLAELAKPHSTPLILPARFRASNQPFPELWWAWAEIWLEKPSVACLIAPDCAQAREDCKAELIDGLAGLGADVLYQQFQKFRAAPEGSSQYRKFIRGFDANSWRSLLAQHPLLARQLGTFLNQFEQATAECLAALTAQRSQLRERFGIDPEAALQGIQALGDAHNRGRRVRRLKFADGTSVIFKPRDCAIEARWNDFLDALNTAGLTPKLATLRYVVGGEPACQHGWFDDITPTLCQPEQIPERFKQFGALIALSYVTRARDLHQDNLICSADGPVLIDSETIVQPEGRPGSGTPTGSEGASLARAASELEESCLGSGLVRFPALNAAGESWDESALCGVPHASKVQAWVELGSDRLSPGEVSLPARAPQHRVRDLDGELCQASDYLSELCQGFSTAYSLMLQSAEFPEIAGTLQALCNTTARIVLRPSRTYSGTLQALASARVQRNGANATLILATLQRVWASATDKPALWPLVSAEAAALLRGDIPTLHVRLNTCDLLGDDGSALSAWTSSAAQSLHARLAQLSEQDLGRQLHWLRASLSEQAPAKARVSVASPPLASAPALAASAIRSVVIDCASQLLAAAVRGNDDELTWLAPGHLTPNARQGRGVSHYLYDGSLGIAWFLAAAGRVLQRPEFTDAARHAYAPVRRFLRDPAAALLASREPVGIAHGLGSVVAGASALGLELGDAKFFEDAERAVALIDARELRGIGQADLEGGVAGALLGIVRLIEATGARTWLRSARPLVRRLQELHHAVHGWRGYDGQPLSGFMHGQSGIAYSLLAYSALTQDEPARALAEAAFAHEDRSYVAARASWPLQLDASKVSPADLSSTWCNGIPGILLARTAYGRVATSEEQTRIANAAFRLYATAPAGVDHLCCGNLGRALALAQLVRVRPMPAMLTETIAAEAIERANSWLAAVVQASELRGRYLLRDDEQQNLAFQPGLFRGIAGVGFAALGLGWPERMGCVLTFKGFVR